MVGQFSWKQGDEVCMTLDLSQKTLKYQVNEEEVPVNILKKLFDFSYHTRRINVIFKRVLNKR